jgi:2'-5' RNA ligase
MNQSPIENSARVFFALWPTEEERIALAAWQPSLHKICGGRVMRDYTLHATLVFLGEVGLHRLEVLQLAAQGVEWQSFELALNMARYWGHNHIVYSAPSTVPPQLVQLVQALEQRLSKHHFHFEKREYQPHITLLRQAQWNDAPLPEMGKVIWRANSFVLVQSAPDEKGANYRVLAKFSSR